MFVDGSGNAGSGAIRSACRSTPNSKMNGRGFRRAGSGGCGANRIHEPCSARLVQIARICWPVANSRQPREDAAMPLPQPRPGKTLLVRKRLLPFSFFPVTRSSRRFGLYDALFAVSPWATIRGAIIDRVEDDEQRLEALAFLEQAEDFYAAATSRFAANPLLTYYSFLNLGKAALRTLGFENSLDRAMHGLSEDTTEGGVELTDSSVTVKDTPGRTNVFAELIEQLGFVRPAHNQVLAVKELLPQVVIGHRIWKEAEPGNDERFVAISEIEIVDDRQAKNVWLRFYIARGDLSRYYITRKRLLDEGQLSGVFHEVDIKGTSRSKDLLCLEQVDPVSYTGRPTDVLMELVDVCKTRLWRIATSVPESGYRKYYIHMTPEGETARLPQLAVLWALFYYFGSVVRYRPHLFDRITAGPYGAFVTEFVSAQADQFLYLLASEMQAREVAKPAII